MFLHEATEQDQAVLGKKAYNLALLLQHGLNVPNGHSISFKDLFHLTHQDLKKVVSKIGGFPVAVRSSGTLEDMDDASFAGMYETYLNVNSVEELEKKINLCFKSAENERVKHYAKEKLEPKDLMDLQSKLCVLVQKMADARHAGVAFGINPISGRSNEVLIEYIEGLGEELVSGKVTPTTIIYCLDSKKIIERANESSRPLTEETIHQLIDQIQKVNAFFGSPQDIEWAIGHDENIYILQSRPITKIQWPTDGDAFTNADFKDGGISARVCSPQMYSLYEASIMSSMQKYFENINLIKDKKQREWINFSYGRAYWNAGEVKKLLYNIPEFNELEFDQDLGIQKDYGEKGAHVSPTNIKTVFKALPVLLGLTKEYRQVKRIIKHFPKKFEEMDQYWKDKTEKLAEIEYSKLIPLFEEMINKYYLQTEPTYFRVIYNNGNYQSDFKKYLNKLGKKLNIKISYIHLISAISSISHLDVQKDLEGLARLKSEDPTLYEKKKLEFLKSHYHHSDTELDLTVPRWGEQPEIVDQMVSQFVTNLKPQANFYQNETKRLIKALNKVNFVSRYFIKKSLFAKLEESRMYLSSREQFRSYSTRAYYVVRLFLLEIGKRFRSMGKIENVNDIFMLTFQEIINTQQSKLEPNLINDRKLRYESYRHFKAPNEFGDNVMQIEKSSAERSESGQIILKGIGCSAGHVDGIARVITDISEQSDVKEGEILITKFTDPGWTPLLGRVQGVATEVGGILSHAAVIGREYGIPAVLNIPGLTDIVKTGDQIHINGSTGELTIKRPH